MEVIESHTVPGGTPLSRIQEYAVGKFHALPSRKGVKKAIKRGQLICNGSEVGTGHWIKSGERLELIHTEKGAPKPFPLALEIIYEDDHFAVIDKPAGIAVSGNQFRTIQNAVIENLHVSAASDKLPWPQPAHRLDYSTSGLLVLAKSKSAQVALGLMFEHRQIEKKYFAVVEGKIDEGGTFDFPVDEKDAKTHFTRKFTTPSLKYGWLSLVELTPVTGRKHQLRSHLSSAGYPILGDKTYGEADKAPKGKGLFLTAIKLRFRHPVTGQQVRFQKNLPNKFSSFMEYEKRRYSYHQSMTV